VERSDVFGGQQREKWQRAMVSRAPMQGIDRTIDRGNEYVIGAEASRTHRSIMARRFSRVLNFSTGDWRGEACRKKVVVWQWFRWKGTKEGRNDQPTDRSIEERIAPSKAMTKPIPYSGMDFSWCPQMFRAPLLCEWL
jgi:hypothetical protein